MTYIISLFSTSIVTYRSSFFCVEVISSTRPLRKQRSTLRFGTIRLKWKTGYGLVYRSTYMGFRWRSHQSKHLSPLRSWVRFSLRTHDANVKTVSQSSVESCVFSPGVPVSSTENVDRVGWV
jgi:hypothetical protein